jgi:hypothetical protein
MLIEDFSWVLKVLESCKTEVHVQAAEKLFNFFLIKWKEDIPAYMKESYYSTFLRIKKTTLYKIEKKYH